MDLIALWRRSVIAWCRSKGDAPRLVRECSRPSIESCSGHSEIAGNLRSGLAAFDQADSAWNLTVSDPAGPAAKVLSSFSAFADGIWALNFLTAPRRAPSNASSDPLGSGAAG